MWKFKRIHSISSFRIRTLYGSLYIWDLVLTQTHLLPHPTSQVALEVFRLALHSVGTTNFLSRRTR